MVLLNSWTKECIINEGDTNPLEKNIISSTKSPEIDESDSWTGDLGCSKTANNERANRDITINYKTLDNYDDNEEQQLETIIQKKQIIFQQKEH